MPTTSVFLALIMVLKLSFSLEDEDFTTESFHPDNTILVTYQGPGAGSTPTDEARNFIVAAAKTINVDISLEEALSALLSTAIKVKILSSSWHHPH